MGRRRRPGRGEGGAPRGRRLPEGAGALRQARRPRAEGHPAVRPARHRQDAAGEGRRAGVRRRVLLPIGVVVRRDVRRRRRRPHPQAVRHRAQARTRHRLHRRARRRRHRAQRHELQPRAGPDPQPAARRAGRLLERPRRDRARRLQPPRRARPGPPAARPVRPPGAGLGPDLSGRRQILTVHTRDKPLAPGVDLDVVARRTAGPRRRRPREHLQRGRHPRRPRRPQRC